MNDKQADKLATDISNNLTRQFGAIFGNGNTV